MNEVTDSLEYVARQRAMLRCLSSYISIATVYDNQDISCDKCTMQHTCADVLTQLRQ